jgi:hypothetical protein
MLSMYSKCEYLVLSIENLVDRFNCILETFILYNMKWIPLEKLYRFLLCELFRNHINHNISLIPNSGDNFIRFGI